MTRKNKIGSIFLVSMLALAGLGVSYAGFSDLITITGTVGIGTVDWDIIEYSGTWVYKIIDDHDIEIRTAPYETVPPGYMYVASSYAKQTLDAAGEPVDDAVTVVFDNIFPCVNFEADITVEYKGTIPGRICVPTIIDGWPNTPDEVAIDKHTEIFISYKRNVDGGLWQTLPKEELIGFQLHQGDQIHVIMRIHLIQDNTLQKRSGSFTYEFCIEQWNDPCPPPCPPPEFTEIDLEIQQFGDIPWEDVYYDSDDDRFEYQLTGQNTNHNLTLGTDTTTNIPLEVGYHPFKLTPPTSMEFWTYWLIKGVHENAEEGTWQAHMWQIINGNEPMFYVKYDGTGYKLVDGLHRDCIGGPEKYFIVPDNYPGAVYTVTGTLTSHCGSTNNIPIQILLYYTTPP